jgi:hypothetical protein
MWARTSKPKQQLFAGPGAVNWVVKTPFLTICEDFVTFLLHPAHENA